MNFEYDVYPDNIRALKRASIDVTPREADVKAVIEYMKERGYTLE